MKNELTYKALMVNITIIPDHVKKRVEHAIKFQKENTNFKVFLQIFTGDEWRFVSIQPIERYSLREFQIRFKVKSLNLPHPESVPVEDLFRVIALCPKQNPSPRDRARGRGHGFK